MFHPDWYITYAVNFYAYKRGREVIHSLTQMYTLQAVFTGATVAQIH